MSFPNVLYFHTHDTGRYVQPYGQPVQTPNYQRLADEGVLFRQCFCAGPTCSPGRAGLLTGQCAHSCGMLGLSNLGWSLTDMDHHLVHTLKKAGYFTALTGTQHEAHSGWEIGYDSVLDSDRENPKGQNNDVIAAEFLNSKPSQPFFLAVGLAETHRHLPYPPPDEVNDPRYTIPPSPLPDVPVIREDMARFKAAVCEADRKLGVVLAALDASGLAENTIVLCTTDHGIGFPGLKCNLTDGGIGVMLMLRGPGGLSGGKVIDALVHHVDVYPTLCELLSIRRPGWLEGVSLMPLIEGRAEKVREDIFSEINWHVSYQPERCVRTGRWKYIRRYSGRDTRVLPNTDDGPSKSYLLENGWGDLPMPQEALYDLVFDPQEKHNLAEDSDYADVLADMQGRLTRWMGHTDDPLLRGPIHIPSGGRYIDVDGVSSAGPWIEVP